MIMKNDSKGVTYIKEVKKDSGAEDILKEILADDVNKIDEMLVAYIHDGHLYIRHTPMTDQMAAYIGLCIINNAM